MKLAAQLRAWRDGRKETQREAAASLGVPVKTYIDWEQGRRTPRGFALTALLDKIAALKKKIVLSLIVKHLKRKLKAAERKPKKKKK